MGRPKKEVAEVPNGQETQERDFDSVFDELRSAADDGEFAEIIGRVYRISQNQNGGKKFLTACGKIDDVYDDDDLGNRFGSGRYQVAYDLVTDDGKHIKKTAYYNIGEEYDRKVPPSSVETAQLGGLSTILSGISPEKVTALLACVKAVKELFAPPPPPPPIDLNAVAALVGAMNKSPSDAIVTACLRGMQETTRPNVLQQIKELKEVKDAIADDTEINAGGGSMDMILKAAMEYLPSILQKKNGDFEQVGAEVLKNNKAIANVVLSDKALTTKFFNAAVKKYGVENANKLAAGFGLQIQTQTAQTAEV